ncbi:retrovirus-related pol polyprotein from transposon TNT 1-94, partial [Tanacetum coccineum]
PRTSSNTSRVNQDNTLRINRGTGYDSQRAVNVVRARENVELEPHYMYMAQIQEVTLDAADNSGPIFDTKPLQKVQNDDDNYNMFANDKEHPKQPESINDTYLEEQSDTNITIDSLDMSTNGEIVDQDDDDLARERDLLASLIDKLKYEIDDNKKANNELSKTNQLKFKDLKKFQAELDRYHDVNYTSKVEIDCAKAKGVISTTSVSRPQLKSNRLEDRVMHNNSEGKKQQVEDHHRNFKFSNNKTFVTACNDSLNAKTSNVNFVCVTCGKCVLNDNHDMCVLHYINGMNSRTKMPMVVPISTREPKRTMNQSVATPLKRTVASESTNQKPRSKIRKQYEQISKTCKWWYSKITPPGYKWKPKTSTVNVKPNVSTVKFGNDQIAPILGYGDLVQGNGNDLLTGSRGTDLYSITLQDTSTPNPICLMAKVTSSQAWLWHRRLSHLNFDTINLRSKYDIVTGLPKLKFVKDHLRSSCELGKAKLVSKSSAVNATNAPDKRQKQNTTPSTSTTIAVDKTPLNIQTTPETTSQAPTQAPTVTTTENINQAKTNKENAKVKEDEFINIFSTPVQERGDTSSRHVDSSNMHTFYQLHPSEHRWTKDHPLEQVIGNPSQSIRTRRQIEIDGEMCMFTLTVSRTEPKNIKEAMDDSAWIKAMQEQLHQFDRLDVWELGDKPLYKNVINMKCLWKNKRDEENNVICNKARQLEGRN